MCSVNAFSALHIHSTHLGLRNGMSITAGKGGMDVSFLVCTILNAGPPTESLGDLLI